MKITQTFTFAVITCVIGSFAFSEDLKSLLTRSGENRAAQSNTSRRIGANRAAPGLEVAQADKAAGPATPETQAKEILNSASERLKSHASIRTSISEKVVMQSNTFVAKGSYLQGQNLQLRMEFSVELRGQKASLLEICDGQVLWTRHDLGEKDQSQITRRDVRQILQAAAKAEQNKVFGDTPLPQASIIADLGIGGLPAMLAAFARDFEFSKVASEKIDDRDVIVLTGTWNAKYRDAWRGGKSKEKISQPLPIYIPDSVRLSLDKESEFPRRIEYLKTLPGESVPSQLLTVDFTKVVFNGKVSKDDFVFIPPERPAPVDITQMYLQRLNPPKAATKAATAKKPAEKQE